MEGSFTKYRTTLKESKPPCVPYLYVVVESCYLLLGGEYTRSPSLTHSLAAIVVASTSRI